ncbi:WXG100 family type VII secretion target [Nocardia jiangxiensis]|uniref:WXG100 family type VII secretion target n=1 Tax=Nocardia jiangxiensis TaxID=282685 RepID=UPI0002D7DBCE|nr:hypothetical protein [Nocardia jiangxiensis]
MAVTTEPGQIPGDGEHPDNFSHWDIYNKFNPLNTANGHTAAQQYNDLANKWSAAADFFASRIRQSSSAAWQGNAAEASRTAISNYAQRAEDLTEALKAMSAQVTAAVDGVNGTKNGVAVPMQHVSRWNFWDGDLFGHHGIRSKKAIDQARDDARLAMKNNYVKNFVDADKQIPVVPKPNEISNPLYSYTPSSSYTPNSGNGPSVPGGSTSGTSGDSGSQSGTSSSQSDSTSAAGYSSSSMPSMSGYSSSTATSPTGYYSGTSPTSTTPSNYSGVGSGSGGDSALNGLGSATGGGLGKSVAGTGSNAAAAAANAAKAAGTNSNMAGMGGMGGAAGKGKGEDDKEHSLPDWLRNMENAEELLGPAPKSIPGGVIGGDFDQDPNTRG